VSVLSPILTKLESDGQILVKKITSVKIVTEIHAAGDKLFVRADEHDEANSCFSLCFAKGLLFF
jgi:hypothetical protein